MFMGVQCTLRRIEHWVSYQYDYSKPVIDLGIIRWSGGCPKFASLVAPLHLEPLNVVQ